MYVYLMCDLHTHIGCVRDGVNIRRDGDAGNDTGRAMITYQATSTLELCKKQMNFMYKYQKSIFLKE